MKKNMLLILVLPFFLASSNDILAGDGMAWLTDLEAAKEKAFNENKLILADFWAQWCQPCKRMDRKTWRDPEVVARSSRLVCLKVNTETDHSLAREYGIRVLPTVMILDGHGTSLMSVTGYKEAEQIIALIEALPESAVSIHLAAGRLADDPDNLELQVALAYQYRLAGFYKKSNEVLAEVAEALTAESPPVLKEQIETFTALNHLLLGETKKAWKLFLRCVENKPESQYRPLQLFCLVKAGSELKKKREAQEYLELLRREFPDDKHTAWAEEVMGR